MRSWPLILVVNLGCNSDVTVVHDRSEREANQILLALARGGVEAQKQLESAGRFEVVVPTRLRDRALLALEQAGLPRSRPVRTRELFAESPLVPSPAWERVRRTLGFEGDIVSALASWPGVVSAEVLLGLPPEGRGAAVLVVHQPGHRPEPSALRRFVGAKLPEGADLALHFEPQVRPPPLAPVSTRPPIWARPWVHKASGGALALIASAAALYLRRRRAS